MLNILFLGDSPTLPTGMGKITRSFIPAFYKLSDRLGKKINITHIATGGVKAFTHLNDDKVVWNVVKSNEFHGFDGHGYYMLQKLLSENKYDCIIFNHDIDVLHQFFFGDLERIGYIGTDGLEDSQRILLYTPIDTKKIYPGWIDVLLKTDKILTYTDFGTKLLEEFHASLKNKVKTLQPRISEEYLTSNTTDKKELREKFGIPQDRFVFYYNGRNDWRKAANILLTAWRKLKEEEKDIFLIIHSHDIIGMGENSIQHLMMIKDEGFKLFPGIMENSDLRKLYLLSDVFVSSCLGEGFGYCPIEAVLSNLPTITTDFPVHRNLYGPGLFVPGEGFVSKTDRVWTIPTIDAFYLKMKEAYELHKEGKLTEMAQKQKEYVLESVLSSENHSSFLASKIEEVLNV